LFDSIKASDSHNGSRVVVGPDNKLYVTTGETYYTPALAQMDESPNGKVLRLNLDGSIPDDNPWKGSPVWTKGHRNPQGLCFGPDSTLYASEHMTWHDDEINIILRGRNYGWPVIEGPTDDGPEFGMKADSNCVDPITSWTPTIAPTGIEYYTSDRFSSWKNSLLLTSLINQGFWHLKLDSSGKNIIGKERFDLFVQYEDTLIPAGRLRDVCVSPDGRVFVSTSNVWTPENLYDRIFEILPEILNHTADDSKQNFSVQVYPNPSNEYITISNLPSQRSTIELIDQLGRNIYSSTVSSIEETISVRNVTSGAYYVRIVSGGEVQTIPVIIK
jgi:glucose/arabinose dehydrogenase